MRRSPLAPFFALATTAALIAAGTVTGQNFLPTGVSVGGGLDVVVSRTVPFPITFPDGSTSTMIDIIGHGRIGPAGTLDPFDFTEDEADLLSGPTSINGYWDDLDDSDDLHNQIFVNDTIPGVVVVTWLDTSESFVQPPVPFTFQVQMFSDGSIRMLWDRRAGQPAGDCIVGLSAGNGVVATESDLSTAVGSALATGGTVFETFTGGADAFDLADGVSTYELFFTPDGSGGYIVTGTTYAPVDFASVDQGRSGCDPLVTGLTFTPTGGGYVVTAGGTFDANYTAGTVVSAQQDDVVNGVTLSFPFAMPGQPASNQIAVVTHGHLATDGALPTGPAAADFTPTVGELLNDPTARIAPLWVDLDLSTGGSLLFHDDGTGTSASVTWDNVPLSFGPNEVASTFQVRLFPDDSIQFLYVQFEPALDDENVLIGVSPGFAAADPGEQDLDTVNTAPIASGTPVVYEFFDGAFGPAPVSEPFDFDDRPNTTARLFPVTWPRAGQTFDVDVDDTGGTIASVAYFFGFPSSLNLGFLNPDLSGCNLLVDISGAAPLRQVSGPAGTPVALIDLTAVPPAIVPLLAQVPFTVTALALDPGRVPSIYPTDELIVNIGSF